VWSRGLTGYCLCGSVCSIRGCVVCHIGRSSHLANGVSVRNKISSLCVGSRVTISVLDGLFFLFFVFCVGSFSF
jgi:hypothetical protein